MRLKTDLKNKTEQQNRHIRSHEYLGGYLGGYYRKHINNSNTRHVQDLSKDLKKVCDLMAFFCTQELFLKMLDTWEITLYSYLCPFTKPFYYYFFPGKVWLMNGRCAMKKERQPEAGRVDSQALGGRQCRLHGHQLKGILKPTHRLRFFLIHYFEVCEKLRYPVLVLEIPTHSHKPYFAQLGVSRNC